MNSRHSRVGPQQNSFSQPMLGSAPYGPPLIVLFCDVRCTSACRICQPVLKYWYTLCVSDVPPFVSYMTTGVSYVELNGD